MVNGLSRIKYVVSHIPYETTRMITNVKKNISVRYFGYVSNVVLMVALCLGLYTRWSHNQDMAILVIAFLGLFVFAISCALIYYFSMEEIGFSLSRLWIGCLLGVVSFNDQAAHVRYGTMEEVMNILLMSSIGVRCFWNVLERLMHLNVANPPLFNKLELLEMLGMGIAALICDSQFLALGLLIVALSLTLISIRLKSYLGVINLLCIVLMAGLLYFPKILQIPVNPFGLIVFIARLAFEPLIDLYFNGKSQLERWEPFLSKSSFTRRFAIFVVLSIQVTFYGFVAKQMPRHKEWYIVVPIFAAFSFVWWSYHLVFIISGWQFMNKISDCNATLRNLSEENRNLKRIMASKGVRHFSVIAQRLTIITLVSSIILNAIGWETKTGLSLSLFLMVIPLESMFMSLLWNLGNTLGGTITGYAIVAPVMSHNGNSATVLPTNAVSELSNRSTAILNRVQQFFSYHLIDTYGCDYSSSGLTSESIQSKLRSFFQRQTSDGPRFDTYLVYYSGEVYDNGDWALADNGRLTFETLMEWWREYHENSEARLILILDTDHSYTWVKHVRALNDDFVAIQTYKRTKFVAEDLEGGSKFRIGDFTSEWVTYNCSIVGKYSDWLENDQPIEAIFGTSRCWTNFTFRLPNDQDMEYHWDANFPRVTKPLIKVTNFPKIGNLCYCCSAILKCMRRKRMLWLPPLELHTGHGFHLVRS